MSVAPPFTPPNAGELIPCSIGTITIIQELHSGHFGLTYLARDEWGNDLVVKVHKPNGTYEEIRSNWAQEHSNLRALRHPNITYIYDAFEYNYTFYIVMERCSGTLDSLIKNPSVNKPILILPLARCILQGLSFMHRAGYVHKDIHAGNVFWTFQRDEFGLADKQAVCFKIGDLGISRLAQDINIFGTVMAKWMLPPEFLDPASFGFVNTQVDIYHTALLLLTMALGYTPAFTNDDIVRGEPRKLAESLASPLGAPLSRALRRHVNQRTQTPLQFWQELSAAR
ncbi:MAG: protein kinase family protein [Myxococcales bacterium]|nr:protein kinase family protein [Myxococcales bacterium]